MLNFRRREGFDKLGELGTNLLLWAFSQRFVVELNRDTIGTVAPAQEAFSVRTMTEDVGGSITMQTAVRSNGLLKIIPERALGLLL
jgi:hypothetical protein